MSSDAKIDGFEERAGRLPTRVVHELAIALISSGQAETYAAAIFAAVENLTEIGDAEPWQLPLDEESTVDDLFDMKHHTAWLVIDDPRTAGTHLKFRYEVRTTSLPKPPGGGQSG